MILVSFTALSSRAAGGPLEPAQPTAGSGGTAYGPGIAVTPLPDGNVRVQHLPTFQRWDGPWRPTSALDRLAGEWPYLLEETATEIRASRLGTTFSQAKVPGAMYEFLPDRVKETLVIPSPPSEKVVRIPFTSGYGIEVAGDAVVLTDANGREAWRSEGFHAWDSSEPPRTWSRPISSIAYSAGTLTLAFDNTMLATATYPLHVDPTWKLNATIGWGASTFQDAVEDQGDHKVKIGWLADNFDDNTNELWTVISGTMTLANGRAQFGGSFEIRGGGPWTDQKFESTVNFASSCGILRILFRHQDIDNEYWLEIARLAQTLTLQKAVAGAVSTIAGPLSVTINGATNYNAKVVALGNAFEIWWNGAKVWSGTDGSAPGSPFGGQVGFAGAGACTFYVDNVRVWNTDIGSITTAVRNAFPVKMRTIHSGSSFNWADLRILSSGDNVTWGDLHYVKAGAKSKTSDADAYVVQDADRRPYYRARADLRTSDESSPALSEIAIIEGSGSWSRPPTLGYEPWLYYIGGMVQAADGNLVLGSSDMALPGKGWSLGFARTYNSRGFISGPLGSVWTHTYNAFLTVGATHANFTDGDGTEHAFEDMGGGLYSSARGMSGTKLVRNGDNTYTTFWKDGSQWTFSSAGKLTEMKDRNGNKLTLTYDGNGRLTKVADDSGIFLMLTYDGSGRISRVGDHNWTVTQRNATAHTGSWTNGDRAFTSNNLYATSSSASATHRYSSYGFTGPANAWITKVEACVEAHTAGDDNLGVRISTTAGVSWSAEQIVNLPGADPNSLTCLDFTSHLSSWTWSSLSDTNFRVEVRYVQVGSQASTNSLDWIPVKVSTASRFWSYAYDAANLLAYVTDPLGKSELFTYYPSSTRMKTFVDRADKVLEFVYDADDSDASEVWTGQYNRTLGTIVWKFKMYAIDKQGFKTLVTDALGNVTTIDRDTVIGHPKKIDGPLAASGLGCSCCGSRGSEKWTVEWDGEFNWFSRADGKNQKTVVTYDWRGNSVRETDALGNYTENTWQNRDNGTVFDSLLLKQRNKRGFFTANEYDWKGNLVKTTDALGNFTRTFYTSAGFVNKTTDKRGFDTVYTYDSHGWRLNTTDPLGHTTKSEYDAVGRLVKSTTAMNFVSRKFYNANDWVVADMNPLNFVTQFEYNGRGDRTALIDANGNRTTTVVNITWAKPQKVIEATSQTTENTYDKLGRLVEVKDPRGKLWKYDFDKFGRQTNVTDPFSQKTRFSYDAAGNVVQRIDGNGKYTNYTLYDALNRIKTVSYQDGDTLTYGYDANGNVISETGYGFTRTTEYDALDRVTKVTFNFGSFSKIVQYTYDQNGNRRTMVYPDGFTVTYVWDADNRLSNIQITGQTWTFIYDNDHRRTAARHPNGLELNATYDQASRVTDLRSNTLANGSTVEFFSYTYDNIVNRKTLANTDGTLSFAYETDYALNATTYETGAKAYYFYDANDNRLFRNETGAKQTEYGYGFDSSLSHREVLSGGTVQVTDDYTYDANGNRLRDSRTVTGQGTTIFDYVYDLENRLVRALVNLSEVASFAYFPDGSRIRRTEAGTPTYFLYDFRDFNGYNDIVEEYDSVGSRVARYVHGPSVDEPLALERGGAWYYYHVDGLGSVTMLTRADKTVANRYVYDDFGGFRSKTEAVANFYTFTGREHDAVTGLHFYRARYYDHVVGRFLNRDPAGMVDGANVYAYAGNNPIGRTDPTGMRLINTWLPCEKYQRCWWDWIPPFYHCVGFPGWWHIDTDAFSSCLSQVSGIGFWWVYTCVIGVFEVCPVLCFPTLVSPIWWACFACVAVFCGPITFAVGWCLNEAKRCI